MRLLSFLCLFALLPCAAPALPPVAERGKETIDSLPQPGALFEDGSIEFQLGLGPQFAMNPRGGPRPRIDDFDAALRLGWMLNSPQGEGALRGNVELLAELSGGVVMKGPGNGFGGAALLLRYNFVQPGARWVPYLQGGVGGIYNDIYKDRTQGMIGGALEFNLTASAGIRYLVSDRCAIFAEANIRHISSANLHDRNFGMNSIGGLAGLSCFF